MKLPVIGIVDIAGHPVGVLVWGRWLLCGAFVMRRWDIYVPWIHVVRIAKGD